MNRVIRFAAAFSLVFFGTVPAQVPDFIWAKQGGGVLNDNANEIAVDGLGNAAVVGRFEGSASFGSTALTSVSNADVFLTKYDTDCKRGNGKRSRRCFSPDQVAIRIVFHQKHLLVSSPNWQSCRTESNRPNIEACRNNVIATISRNSQARIGTAI